jgi:hypothetical protein
VIGQRLHVSIQQLAQVMNGTSHRACRHADPSVRPVVVAGVLGRASKGLREPLRPQLRPGRSLNCSSGDTGADTVPRSRRTAPPAWSNTRASPTRRVYFPGVGRGA